MGIFPDAQGQLTSQSMDRSYQIANPSEILWLSPLPARIKKNQSKTKQSDSDKGPRIMPCSEKGISLLGTILIIFHGTKPQFRHEQ